MRPILIVSLALSSMVLYEAMTDPTWLQDSQRWIHNLTSGQSIHFEPAETEAHLTALIQSGRHQDGKKMLQSDVELHNWLTQRLEKEGEADLQTLADEIQASCPRYLKLSSTAMESSSVEGLLEQITHWKDMDDRDFTHVTVVARTRAAGLGYEAVVFAGQRQGDLVPELIGNGGDQFFVVCPLCGHPQSGLVLARNRTVFLECPDCHRVYAIVAVDTHGVFHFVSRYLNGYAPHAHFPAHLKMTRLAEMARIWAEVIHTIDYLPDSPSDSEDYDIWQTAPETEKLGTGDCEDSSILLADWLTSRGFDVRVALGHYGNKGGHAWVIVRLDGNSYLLEATDPHVDVTRPPLANEADELYVPNAMFDREAIYTRRFPNAPFNGDYWSPDQWVRVEQPPGSKTFPSVAARVSGKLKAKQPAAAPLQH